MDVPTKRQHMESELSSSHNAVTLSGSHFEHDEQIHSKTASLSKCRTDSEAEREEEDFLYEEEEEDMDLKAEDYSYLLSKTLVVLSGML
uniref:Uncharacterized protein n=1 Tax=Sphaerodactylus townsendi TaxID=933632 RepID=A0ACB8FD73_9SAUR